ncbi:MAG: pilus assembly protein TadG-related protein [Chloroflexota bacterium]
MNDKRSQRGQALILIVLGIVGLVAITALAIDAGNAFSDRRNAQNAADTAALAAALAKVNNQSISDASISDTVKNITTPNGYPDTRITVNAVIYVPGSNPNAGITVNNPPGVYDCDPSDTPSPYIDDPDYIQVIIHSTVNTFFAPIVGIDQLHNCVEAIARARPSYTAPMFFGNAIVSLAPTDCSAFRVSGTGDVTVTGGGVFVNSSCSGSQPSSNAFRQEGSSSLTAPSISVVGGASYTPGDVTPAPTVGAEQIPYHPEYIWPAPTCSGAGSYTKVGNIATLTPGSFSSFPPVGGSVKTYILQSGIYCISGNWSAGSQDSYTGSNVLLYIINGSVTWNGAATINLDAPDSGEFAGLLLYLPLTNDSDVSINGNSSSQFIGTILAPASDIDVAGTGSTDGLYSQVIGYIIKLTGDSATNINYSDEDNYDITIPPSIELAR